MLINWIEKKIARRIINKIKNQIPELKTTALEYLEEHKDELLDKCKEVIKQAIKDFVATKINR